MKIKSITFKEDLRTIKKNTNIIFDNNITVITGDNGSGKSTIIKSIYNKTIDNSKMNNDIFTVETDISHSDIIVDLDENFKIGNTIVLDSCEGLLKHLSYFNDENMDLQVTCMKSSSGEGLLLQLANLNNIKNLSEKLLILDEPEKGLSIKQQLKTAKYLKFLVDKYNGLQIIVVTHSFGLLSYFNEVYSTNEFKYVKSSYYLDTMFDL